VRLERRRWGVEGVGEGVGGEKAGVTKRARVRMGEPEYLIP